MTAPPAPGWHAVRVSTKRAAARFDKWWVSVPFLLMHLVPIAAIWTGVTATDVILLFVLWATRMFGVTAGYHRYFSHRSFKTSRPVQFLLAFLAETSAQKGVLWWAAHHRHHHKHSDLPPDVHSPVQEGFLYSHVGWVLDDATAGTDFDRVRDLTKFPELRFIDRYHLLPPILLGIATWLAFGWSGLVVGFFGSTVLLYHTTFFINSLAHVIGSRRYDTTDDSRNSWWLALLTMGEGWHNNHHHYQASCRQGFFWWEIDVTYYVIKLMERVGLVWGVHEPPAKVLQPAKKRSPVAAIARSRSAGA